MAKIIIFSAVMLIIFTLFLFLIISAMSFIGESGGLKNFVKNFIEGKNER